MTIAIVKRLEVIEVQEEEGAGTIVALGALEFLVEGGNESAVVG